MDARTCSPIQAKRTLASGSPGAYLHPPVGTAIFWRANPAGHPTSGSSAAASSRRALATRTLDCTAIGRITAKASCLPAVGNVPSWLVVRAGGFVLLKGPGEERAARRRRASGSVVWPCCEAADMGALRCRGPSGRGPSGRGPSGGAEGCGGAEGGSADGSDGTASPRSILAVCAAPVEMGIAGPRVPAALCARGLSLRWAAARRRRVTLPPSGVKTSTDKTSPEGLTAVTLAGAVNCLPALRPVYSKIDPTPMLLRHPSSLPARCLLSAAISSTATCSTPGLAPVICIAVADLTRPPGGRTASELSVSAGNVCVFCKSSDTSPLRDDEVPSWVTALSRPAVGHGVGDSGRWNGLMWIKNCRLSSVTKSRQQVRSSPLANRRISSTTASTSSASAAPHISRSSWTPAAL
mmetsp:Transcript_10581/g.22889  ORF Transcript_10581/g.22889 Transcript_10581/m.22889 type:complete len:409 (+) Transcript_10581:1149-2375(+)